jgi:predicted dehydrogenase
VGAFRWAILGTGHAATKFAMGLRTARGAEVAAVGSRSLERAGRFVNRTGLRCTVADYASALDGDIDAVYVATPPSTHERLAVLALEAARPVLVEKPFASDGAGARRIAAVARQHSVFCMEAMWTRFLPLTQRIEVLLGRGALGQLVGMVGSFGKADIPASGPVIDPGLGGGSLLDRGVYPLSFMIRALGPPTEATATMALTPTGVDAECTALLRFDGGTLATMQSSLRGFLANELRYVGTKATLTVRPPIYRPVTARLQRHADSTAPRIPSARTERAWTQGLRQAAQLLMPDGLTAPSSLVWRPYAGNGYHYQADEVARCVRAGLLESPVMPLAESVAVLEAVDLIRAGSGHPGPAAGRTEHS